MNGAHVPKTTINKYGDPTRRKNYVGPDTNTLGGTQQEVFAITQAAGVKSLTKRYLGLRVNPAVRSHITGSTLVQRFRIDALFVSIFPFCLTIMSRHEPTSIPYACQLPDTLRQDTSGGRCLPPPARKESASGTRATHSS